MDKKKFYTNRTNIVIFATLCCILWGSAYPAIKYGYKMFDIAANDIPSKFIFAGYRFALAGIIVLITCVFSRKKLFDFSIRQIGQVTILGLTQTTLQYMFFYIGLAYTTGIRGSIINGTGAFFSIILAHFIYKNDRLNFNKVLGCVIGFLGVIVVNLNGQSFFDTSFSLKGEGSVMLAAFMLSASSIYGKRITQNQDASIVTGYQLLIGGVILTVLGFVCGGHLNGFNLKSTSLLVYMALLSSVAFVLWTELLKYNKVGIISVFNFSIPIFGSLLSAIFLRENIFNIKILIGLILVCTGIYLVYKIKDTEKENK